MPDNSPVIAPEQLQQGYTNISVPNPLNITVPEVKPTGQLDNPVNPFQAAQLQARYLMGQESWRNNTDIEKPYNVTVSQRERYDDPSLGYTAFDSGIEQKYGDKHWIQSATNNLIKGGANAVGSFVNGILSIPNIIGSLAKGDFSNNYDNDITKSINDFTNNLENSLPSYETSYKKNNPFLSYIDPLHLPTFINNWTNIGKNLGYTVGAIGSAVAEDFAIGTLTGGAGLPAALAANATQLNKFIKYLNGGEEAAQAFNTAVKGGKSVQNAIDIASTANKTLTKGRYYMNLFTSAYAEGVTEAANINTQTYKDLVDKYRQETGEDPNYQKISEFKSAAKSASDTGLLFNVALLMGTESQLFGNILKPTGLVQQQLERAVGENLELASKNINEFAVRETSTGFKKFAKNTLPLFKDNALEPFQEGAQYVISQGTEDYYSRRLHEPSIDSTDNFLKSFSKGIHDTLFTTEGKENLAMGFLSGFLIHGINKVSNRSRGITDSKTQLANQVKDMMNGTTVTGLFDTQYSEMVTQQSLSSDYDRAVKSGDLYHAKNLRYQQLFNFVESGVRAGKYELRVDQLNQLKKLQDTDFKTMFGIDYTTENKTNISHFVDGVINKAAQIKSSIDKVNNAFVNPYNQRTENNKNEDNGEINRWKAFEFYKTQLALSSSTIQNNKERVNGIAESIQKIVPTIDANKIMALTTPEGISSLVKEFNTKIAELKNNEELAKSNPDLVKGFKKDRKFLEDKVETLQSNLKNFDAEKYLTEVNELHNYFANGETTNKDANVDIIDSLSLFNQSADMAKLTKATTDGIKYYRDLMTNKGFNTFTLDVYNKYKVADDHIQIGEDGSFSFKDAKVETPEQSQENPVVAEHDKEYTLEEKQALETIAHKEQEGQTLTDEELELKKANPEAVQKEKEVRDINKKKQTRPNPAAPISPTNPNISTISVPEEDEIDTTPVGEYEQNITPKERSYEKIFQGLNPVRFLNQMYSPEKGDYNFKESLRKLLFGRKPSDITNKVTIEVVPSTKGKTSSDYSLITGFSNLYRRGFDTDATVKIGNTVVGILHPSESLTFKRGDSYQPIINLTKEEYEEVTKNNPYSYPLFMQEVRNYKDIYDEIAKGDKLSNEQLNKLTNIELSYGNAVHTNNPSAAVKLGDVAVKQKGDVVLSFPNVENENGREKTSRPLILNQSELSQQQIDETHEFISNNLEHLRSQGRRYVYLNRMPDGTFSKIGIFAARPITQDASYLEDTFLKLKEASTPETISEFNTKFADEIYISDSRKGRTGKADIRLRKESNGDVSLTIHYKDKGNKDINKVLTVSKDRLYQLTNIEALSQEFNKQMNSGDLGRIGMRISSQDFKRSILSDEQTSMAELQDKLTIASSTPNLYDNYSVRFTKKQVEKVSKPTTENTSNSVEELSLEQEIKHGFEQLAEGLKQGAEANSRNKMQEYANRILNGEKKERVLDGLPPSMVSGVENILNNEKTNEQVPTLDISNDNTEHQSTQDKVVTKGKLFNEPNPETATISEAYKQANGIQTPNGTPITQINEVVAKEIADAYDKMKDEPDNPEVKRAYEAMADETLKQYKVIKDAGYKIELWDGKGEPYKGASDMIRDVRDNKHLYVLPTESEFGQSKITDDDKEKNPLLRDSGETDINGKKLLLNDHFRAVHDFFGHTERGNGFGAVGEENAWDIHSRMYTPLARRAMTTETRGQNSWVNFGKHMRNEDGSIKTKGDEGYLSVLDRPFAEQKIGLLPNVYSKTLEERNEVLQPETRLPQRLPEKEQVVEKQQEDLRLSPVDEKVDTPAYSKHRMAIWEAIRLHQYDDMVANGEVSLDHLRDVFKSTGISEGDADEIQFRLNNVQLGYNVADLLTLDRKEPKFAYVRNYMVQNGSLTDAVKNDVISPEAASSILHAQSYSPIYDKELQDTIKNKLQQKEEEKKRVSIIQDNISEESLSKEANVSADDSVIETETPTESVYNQIDEFPKVDEAAISVGDTIKFNDIEWKVLDRTPFGNLHISTEDAKAGRENERIINESKVSKVKNEVVLLASDPRVRILDRVAKLFPQIQYKFVDVNSDWKGRFNKGIVELNKRNFTEDTAIHEYLHPFVESLRLDNQKVYRDLLEDLTENGQNYIQEVAQSKQYDNIGSERKLDEALVRYLSNDMAQNFDSNGRVDEDKKSDWFDRATTAMKGWYQWFSNLFLRILNRQDKQNPNNVVPVVHEGFDLTNGEDLSTITELQQIAKLNFDKKAATPEEIALKDKYFLSKGQNLSDEQKALRDRNREIIKKETNYLNDLVEAKKSSPIKAKDRAAIINLSPKDLDNSEYDFKFTVKDMADFLTFSDNVQFDLGNNLEAINTLESYQYANQEEADNFLKKLKSKLEVLRDTVNRRIGSKNLGDDVAALTAIVRDYNGVESTLEYIRLGTTGLQIAQNTISSINSELRPENIDKLKPEDVQRLQRDLQEVRTLMGMYDDVNSLLKYHWNDFDSEEADGLKIDLAVANASKQEIGKIVTKLTTEWLFPQFDELQQNVIAQNPDRKDLLLSKKDFVQRLKYIERDASYLTYWLGSAITSRDPISQVIAVKIKDVLNQNYESEQKLADDTRVSFRKFLGDKGLTNNTKVVKDYYEKNYIRTIQSWEVVGKDENGETTHDYVNRLALHTEFDWHRYDDDLRKETKNYPEAFSDLQRKENDSKRFDWIKNNTQKVNSGRKDINGEVIYNQIPSEKYRNNEYTRLKNDVHFKFLSDSYNRANESYADQSLQYGILPQAYKEESIIQKTKDRYNKLKGYGKDLVSDTQKNSFEKAEQAIKDAGSKVLGGDAYESIEDLNLDDTYYRNIKSPYTHLIEDQSQVDTNLPETILTFNKAANAYSSLKELQPNIENFKLLLSSNAKFGIDARKAMKVSRDLTKVFDRFASKPQSDVAERLNKQLLSQLDDVFYGDAEFQQNANIAGIKINLNTIGKNVGFYTAAVNLAGNLFAGISNVTVGNAQTLGEAIGGRYYGVKDWGKAQLDYSKNLPKFLADGTLPIKSKITQLGVKYDAIQGEFRDANGKVVTGNILKRKFNTSALFLLSHAGEHQIQLTGMLALMNATKVPLKSGGTVSLYDAYQNDGKGYFKLRDDANWSIKDENEFTRKLHSISRDLNGAYASYDKSMLQRYWIGRLVLQYRKYMYPAFRSRFARERVDLERGDVDKGYYRTFFRKLINETKEHNFNILAAFRDTISDKYSKNKMTAQERYAHNKFLFDMSVLGGTFALAGFLVGGGGDTDDDKYNQWMVNSAGLLTLRLRSDIGTYSVFSAQDFSKQLQNPAASIQSVTNITDFIGQFVTSPFDEYKQNSSSHTEGDSKLGAKFKKLVPILRQYNKITSPEEQEKYYSLINEK